MVVVPLVVWLVQSADDTLPTTVVCETSLLTHVHNGRRVFGSLLSRNLEIGWGVPPWDTPRRRSPEYEVTEHDVLEHDITGVGVKVVAVHRRLHDLPASLLFFDDGVYNFLGTPRGEGDRLNDDLAIVGRLPRLHLADDLLFIGDVQFAIPIVGLGSRVDQRVNDLFCCCYPYCLHVASSGVVVHYRDICGASVPPWDTHPEGGQTTTPASS